MNKKYIALIVVALILIGAGLGLRFYRHSKIGQIISASSAQYYCPMHPTYISEKPGDCPICNMKLVLKESGARASLVKVCILHKCKMTNCPMEFPLKSGQKIDCPVCGSHIAQADEVSKGKILYYRHPMRPEVTSPVTKKDEMGMDYVAVYSEESADTPVSGQAAIELSQARRQMIGMKSEAVTKRRLVFTVRASGRVAYDPDLYNAIAEYQEAVKAHDKVQGSPWPDVLEHAEALTRASVLRLRQLGLSENQIEELSKNNENSTNLLLGSQGGSVWVYAQVYEYEVGLVKAGQKVELTTPAYPDKKFYGLVKAIDPILSVETRSLKARIEVPDPESLLKLEMYVNASIRVDLGTKLALPEEALVDTGIRKIAFVDLGEGRIEPREVRVGREADGYYELLGGVAGGERVVTSAQFLIDSESKLKAAISKPANEHEH